VPTRGTITDLQARFQKDGERYAEFRPQYPDVIIRALASRIAAVKVPAVLPVLDIGSGTGIFTRQIAAHLPAAIPLIGIEPASGMR